jgi:ubiquinone/menaquinone biosynthesis C-methylase UbiE
MSLLVPARRFDCGVLEMIDRPAADPGLLRDELASIRGVNRFFGGFSAIRGSILSLINGSHDGKEIRILDLGTGSADLPVYLVQLGRSLNRKFHITAVDNNATVLQVSRARTKPYPEITIQPGDILSMDYPPGAFDIVFCSLTLHHFSREDGVRIISSMNQLSRIGIVVNDLSRSWLAAWAAKLYTRLTTSNPMTLFDSYLSVLRGFTPRELGEMASEAGVRNFSVRTHPLFRLLLIGKH